MLELSKTKQFCINCIHCIQASKDPTLWKCSKHDKVSPITGEATPHYCSTVRAGYGMDYDCRDYTAKVDFQGKG